MNPTVFQKFFMSKKVKEKKVGGHHDCPQIFLSHCIETFRREHFIVSEKFWFRNFSFRRGVGVSGFSVKLFCFTKPKEFVKEPFCVSGKFPDGKNVKERKGVGITTVLRYCLFFSSETFRRGTLLRFKNVLMSKNVKDGKKGGHHHCASKMFVSQ